MPDNEGEDIFDVDAADEEARPAVAEDLRLFQIYEGSKIAVSKQVGSMWRKRRDAAKTTYAEIYKVWEEVLRYYNNHQNKNGTGPTGTFRRGDSTENVVFSNLNVVIPAVYSKNPVIECSTSDPEDQPMCDTLSVLLTTLLQKRTMLNAKQKIKKATGLGLLTNMGVLKIEWELKDDSRLMAIQELETITTQMAQAKDTKEAEELYGQLEALERQMEVRKESGPCLSVVMGHNLIIDPYAEMPDGTDASWIMEDVFIPTSYLNARFTKPDPEEEGKEKAARVLIYKPTHKASFAAGVGTRDDGLGIVMDAISTTSGDEPESHQTDERAAYINMYYTQCSYVWDKTTRRVFLFHVDDWKWPIWVWDDPLNISRFYPYFIFGFSLSTGGTVAPGEVSYYLDQQDEINEINQQIVRIRRSVFDYFFYNSDVVDQEQVESFLQVLRGEKPNGTHIVGVRAGDRKISDMIEAFKPPQLEYEALFNKQAIFDSVNRISNVSDALRGVQFKTNTTEDAVNLYQDSMKISVGSKVDVVEDTVADLANSLAELCVQRYTVEDVSAIVGKSLGAAWMQMGLQDFVTNYSVEVVAGSMEKPNSIFKKKEAVEIVQAVGQFANAAPGSTLKIMLKVLSQAFTEIVIKKEDWDAMDQEIAAMTQKGISTGAQPGQEGEAAAGGGEQLPPEIEQEVVQRKKQGATDEDLISFIQQSMEGRGNGSANRQ